MGENMFNLNKDVNSRDNIIFKENYSPDKYLGGICRFERLSLKNLELLIDNKFIELNQCQNNSPTTEEILEFMKKYPKYTAHGYAVSLDREDYRVTLEGVEKNTSAESKEELEDFTKLFHLADDFITDSYMYCWFD